MPSRPDIAAVRRLLDDVVDSFEKLEVLVYLHRMGDALTTPSSLSQALGIPQDEVERCMKALKDARVLEAQGPWASSVAALARMYDEDRIEILNLMTQTALSRVRKEAARVFADAFVLRPKKKGDPDA